MSTCFTVGHHFLVIQGNVSRQSDIKSAIIRPLALYWILSPYWFQFFSVAHHEQNFVFAYWLNIGCLPTQTQIERSRIPDPGAFSTSSCPLGIYGPLLHGLVVSPKSLIIIFVCLELKAQQTTVQQRQRMTMKSGPLSLPANSQLSTLSTSCASLKNNLSSLSSFVCWPKEVKQWQGEIALSPQKKAGASNGTTLCGQSCKKIVECENISGFNTIQLSQQKINEGRGAREAHSSKNCALGATATHMVPMGKVHTTAPAATMRPKIHSCLSTLPVAISPPRLASPDQNSLLTRLINSAATALHRS